MYMKLLLRKIFPNSLRIKKIRGEASTRSFYRIFFRNYSLVAMVYAQENSDEISRILKLTSLYNNYGIRVPKIIDIFDDQIVIQEDLGDLSLQKLFRLLKVDGKKKMLQKIAGIVKKMSEINFLDQDRILDGARLKWEMDFFIKNFALKFSPSLFSQKKLRNECFTLVDRINKLTVFAHRDFHSRNMLCFKDEVCLVDFQDSLEGPIYYDMVSFAFDSYLDLQSQRNRFFNIIESKNLKLDYEQVYLTALQRNIKALGTFGYQIVEKKNLSYKRYINRTVRHILGNIMVESSFSYGSELLKTFIFE